MNDQCRLLVSVALCGRMCPGNDLWVQLHRITLHCLSKKAQILTDTESQRARGLNGENEFGES